MSQAYRNLQEQQLLALRQLERRVANLERRAIGNPSTQSKSSQNDTITATATPGTAITNVSITVARPGRYALLAIFDFAGTATGWTAAFGIVVKNGVELAPNIRAITRDVGAASAGGSTPVFQVVTLAAGDVLTLGAWKSAAGGTVLSTSTTTLQMILLGPV